MRREIKPASRKRALGPANPTKTAAQIAVFAPFFPQLAVVLGSAFVQFPDAVEHCLELPLRGIEGFPIGNAPGHHPSLLFARCGGFPLLVFRGRAHFYEGYSMEQVGFPIRVAAALGARAVLLTNAAGGINPRLRCGSFMLVADHINFMGANPLRNEAGFDAGRFVDLSEVYDPGLRQLMLKAARSEKVPLRQGVYAAVPGPSYETPAEIRALRRLGADAVGMSTVPEAVAARHCHLAVAALSCITNAAAGLGTRAITHTEVLEEGRRSRNQAARLISHFARLYYGQSNRGV